MHNVTVVAVLHTLAADSLFLLKNFFSSPTRISFWNFVCCQDEDQKRFLVCFTRLVSALSDRLLSTSEMFFGVLSFVKIVCSVHVYARACQT